MVKFKSYNYLLQRKATNGHKPPVAFSFYILNKSASIPVSTKSSNSGINSASFL